MPAQVDQEVRGSAADGPTISSRGLRVSGDNFGPGLEKGMNALLGGTGRRTAPLPVCAAPQHQRADPLAHRSAGPQKPSACFRSDRAQSQRRAANSRPQDRMRQRRAP